MEPRRVCGTTKPIIGMVHLPPLPGAARFNDDRQELRQRARTDARALAAGGVDAVIVENFGDAPFYPDQVPPTTVATMTDLTRSVRMAIDLPLGVNVLRNDAEAALAIADATGAGFIRVNIHTGARITDQGLIQGTAHETMRLRARLNTDVKVLADLDVKHSAPLAEDAYHSEAMADTVERGLADGVIVSGTQTGDRPPLATVETAVERREHLDLETPVLVGSGVTGDTVADYLEVADGVIVGSALKEGGCPQNPVDQARVACLVEAANR
jgi:membrane complex biogenesis BtpA family protein